MSKKIYPLIIIGSGPAGLTAAIYAARSQLETLLIEGEQPGGQLMGTSAVENWPGNKSIMGPELMLKMQDHAKSLGTQFQSGVIESVNFQQKPFQVTTNKGNHFFAQAIIIATGSTPKRLDCKGEDTYWGKGVTTCAVCDGAFYKDMPVVVIGGGDSAMEHASFLLNFTKDITIVQILDHLTAAESMKKRVVDNPAIKIMYNSTVTEFKGSNDHLESVIVKDQKTGQSTELKVRGAFLAVGLQPNTEFLKGQVALNKWGYLELQDQTKTSVKGIFGAGDVHDYRYRQAITAAGAGCMAALDAEKYLKEN